MYTYKIAGEIEGKRIDDRVTVMERLGNEQDIEQFIKQYIVRWAMVKGEVISAWWVTMEQI